MHGYIKYSDGSTSQELWSQEDAFKEISRAKKSGKILPIEASELLEVIRDELPPQEVAEEIKNYHLNSKHSEEPAHPARPRMGVSSN